MEKKCFVIQRFDNARYDRLYDEVFKPSIEAAGFTPYRVDRDPSASIPIDSIEREISNADACFIEISEDAPNVWFELGFALAKDKPLCLVCSGVRTRFPFDVQHRQVIIYPEHPTPSDYQELREKIKARLISVVERDVTANQRAETARALSIGPQTNGLRAHELVALTIVFQSHLEGGVTTQELKRDMERAGYTAAATALAVTGLKRVGYVSVDSIEDQNGYPYKVFGVTAKGEEWLVEHEDELQLEVQRNDSPAMGITDEDIHF